MLPAGGARLTLVTRADCHLCEQLHNELEALRGRYPLPAVELVDVDADPQLLQRYGLKVPVLLLNDVPVCHFRLDRAELLRLLRL
ncbi:MAG: glutaredoxin family protein [Steroidobacteraceae bacterium]|jgi:hypothetical protein